MKRRKFNTLLGGWACLRLPGGRRSHTGLPLLGVEEADRFIFVPSGYGTCRRPKRFQFASRSETCQSAEKWPKRAKLVPVRDSTIIVVGHLAPGRRCCRAAAMDC